MASPLCCSSQELSMMLRLLQLLKPWFGSLHPLLQVCSALNHLLSACMFSLLLIISVHANLLHGVAVSDDAEHALQDGAIYSLAANMVAGNQILTSSSKSFPGHVIREPPRRLMAPMRRSLVSQQGKRPWNYLGSSRMFPNHPSHEPGHPWRRKAQPVRS